MHNLTIDIRRVWDVAAVIPITLAEAKIACRVDFTTDDAFITELIDQCISEVEEWCSIAIIPQTITVEGNVYCWSDYALIGPVTGILSVQTASGEQGSGIPNYETLESGWQIQGNVFKKGVHGDLTHFSTSTAYGNYRHRIVYTAGRAEISKALKKAILNLIAFRYDNRGDHEIDLSEDVKRQLNQFKDYSW